MAFKIKDNLDLYGNQLLNFALQSDSGFPQSPQVGHIFNYTGTGVMANHAVMCVDETTKAFKALAFVDEIATNTAFTELAERVDDLETALGTDEKDVLDTWEEVKTFLASIKESDGDLMTMLNGKLDKSGGTIDGVFGALSIKRNNAYASAIRFENTSGVLGYIGINDDYNAKVWDKNGNDVGIILHSGNIGEYALKTDGSNEITGDNGLRWADNMDFDTLRMGLRTFRSYNGTSVEGVFPSTNYGTVLHVGTNVQNYAFQLGSSVNADGLFYRGYYASVQQWNDWKTIAFTDSDITGNAGSATKLQTARTIWGQSFDGTGNVRGDLNLDYARITFAESANDFYIGWGNSNMFAYANYYGHYFTTDGYERMRIVQNGNVGIGTDNPQYELDVNGGVRTKGVYVAKDYGLFLAAGNEGIYLSNNSLHWHGTDNGWKSSLMNFAEDEVTLHKKMTINGDLHVTGNIIADKEVSAGGAGTEGESGDGGAEVISQQLAKGQSTYTITNTIKRSDIAVSLYEANVINGQTIWSLCLADIEVTNTTITVTFGSATSVNHKLVAVG